jgi:hypothetical protein
MPGMHVGTIENCPELEELPEESLMEVDAPEK